LPVASILVKSLLWQTVRRRELLKNAKAIDDLPMTG